MERQHQTFVDKEEEEQDQKNEEQQTKHQSPPSSNSPEFSFTISLQISDENKSFAIDLSPADEIFFHGHLLPLHFLSNLPVSPRTSTGSLDSFTLPIQELLQEHPPRNDEHVSLDDHPTFQENRCLDGKERGKSKPFSFFGLSKWKKGCETRKSSQETDTKQKKNSKFDAVKRYMKLVKPFLSFRNRRMNNRELQRQSYSFSGNIRSKRGLRGKREDRFFSAPASMRTSPTNSGLLTPISTSNDSTMEELQAAIQAAIAHCKNSIATEDIIKKHEVLGLDQLN